MHHHTYNIKSCSQQGWSPRTATVVLFTFCTFRVTYVLNLSGEQDTKCDLHRHTLSSHHLQHCKFSVSTVHPERPQMKSPYGKISLGFKSQMFKMFFTCIKFSITAFLEIQAQTNKNMQLLICSEIWTECKILKNTDT